MYTLGDGSNPLPNMEPGKTESLYWAIHKESAST